MVRTALYVGGLALVGGLLLWWGVVIGSQRVPAAFQISGPEAARYGLTDFPVGTASAFGQQYLMLCLTHPDPNNRDAVAARSNALKQLASSGVETGCGWDGRGAPQTPASVVFTGRVEPVALHTGGRAAYLSFAVTMTDGRLFTAIVPVWTSSVSAQITGAFRVVGDIGVMPPGQIGASPPIKDTRAVDSDLAGKVQSQVLLPFLIAWGKSDAVQLSLSVTSDATPVARSGLGELLVNPSITEAVVYTPKTSDSGVITYSDGDVVEVWTGVTWQRDTAHQKATYRITLRLVAGKWAVADINGSTVDENGGGPSESTTTQSPTTTTPTAPASTPTPTTTPGG